MSGIGEKIRALREARGLSRKAFGARIGAAEAKVQAVEIGKQRADHEFLMNVVTGLGVDANWLLSEAVGFAEGEEIQGGFEGASGWARVDAADDGVKDWFGISRAFLRDRGVASEDLLIVTVRGRSMEPRLTEGDQVLVHCGERELRDGQTFVVRFGDDLIVKQVQVLPQAHVQLVSANREYPPVLVDLNATDMVVIGRVLVALHLF